MSETEWPQVGDRVAVYQYRVGGGAYIRIEGVDRLTKTRVVLNGGEWFPRESLSRRGAGSWGTTTYLLRPEDERVAKARSENRRIALHSEVGDAFEAWRRASNTDDGTLLRALQASVEAALADLGESK